MAAPKSLLLIPLLVATLSTGALGQFVTFEPHASVTVKPGQSMPFQLTFHVKSPYHINSNRPTVAELIPTQIFFTPPADTSIGHVLYPPGQLTSFPFDPSQKLSVYSGDVVITATLMASKAAPPGIFTVHGEFKYQAADNNAAYPPKKLPFHFSARVLSASRSVTRHPKLHPRQAP